MRISRSYSVLLVVLSLTACALHAQKEVDLAKVPNRDITCAITLENSVWQPNSSALIRGVVTNVSDHSATFMVQPTLLLRPKDPEGDTYWSPVDIFHAVPLGTIARSIGKGEKQAQVIQPRSIPLEFKKGHQELQFQIDASSLLWAKQSALYGRRNNCFLLSNRQRIP